MAAESSTLDRNHGPATLGALQGVDFEGSRFIVHLAQQLRQREAQGALTC